MNSNFKKDLMAGLRASPKTISSMYFYDKKGDELFQQIMALPEYYLTNAELEIFSQQCTEMIKHFGLSTKVPFEVIELGAGDGTKTIKLLETMLSEGLDFGYAPIDISENALQQLKRKLSIQLPLLNVSTKQGDYFGVLKDLQHEKLPKIMLFLGSNIGNMDDNESKNFIAKLAMQMRQGDKLLLGVDLIKKESIVLPAYNDSRGITAAFNLNILQRANTELLSNFVLSRFEHVAEYSSSTGIAKSFLKSTADQMVLIDKEEFIFSENELIQTETSRKFDQSLIDHLIAGTGLRQLAVMKDTQSLFCDYIFAKDSAV